jgi:hypothetical protein
MKMKRFVLALTLVTLLTAAAVAIPLQAQNATPTPRPTPAPGSVVLVVGPVDFVDGLIVVNNYRIEPAGVFQPAILVEGDMVIVTGIVQADGRTILAQTFEFFGDPVITPTPTVWATSVPIGPTPDPRTPTATPLPTMTPFFTATPEWDDCNQPNHPVGLQLAESFGVSYEEIMNWHCNGFGFGEIARAYLLAAQTERPAQTYFDLKANGMGWGEIVRDAGIHGSEHRTLAPGQVIGNGRGNGNGNGQGNGNGNGQGNGNGNGQGNGNGNGNGNGQGNGNGNGGG